MSFALALLDKNPHRIQTTDIVWKLLLFSMLKANKQTHTLKKKTHSVEIIFSIVKAAAADAQASYSIMSLGLT